MKQQMHRFWIIFNFLCVFRESNGCWLRKGVCAIFRDVHFGRSHDFVVWCKLHLSYYIFVFSTLSLPFILYNSKYTNIQPWQTKFSRPFVLVILSIDKWRSTCWIVQCVVEYRVCLLIFEQILYIICYNEQQ